MTQLPRMKAGDFELEVSSAAVGNPGSKLLDGDSNTYWQTATAIDSSSGTSAKRPHWIRVINRREACLRELKMLVRKSHGNFVPNAVSVYVGKDQGSLALLCQSQLAGKLNTEGCTSVDLLQGAAPLRQASRVVELRIEDNIDNGLQSRVHGLHFAFDDEEPPSDFMPSFRRLFDEATCSDVTFQAGGEQVRAHRCILIARSAVMRALLTNGMSESAHGATIEVADVEPAVLRELLSYLYTDRLSAAGADLAEKLLVAADKYQVHRLCHLCETRLIEKLSVETCCDLLALGAAQGRSRLSEAALDFAMENAEGILGTAGMRRLVAEWPELLVELFAAAKLGVRRAREACEGVGRSLKRSRSS
mmetsp:Transcript_57306/g.167728  ORF Transcript_57306/g.167728 Transcript_57306/m.167728 type:complete len:362 (+) Transcript_57306:57-1142(+)